jgi:hypothetical protein
MVPDLMRIVDSASPCEAELAMYVLISGNSDETWRAVILISQSGNPQKQIAVLDALEKNWGTAPRQVASLLANRALSEDGHVAVRACTSLQNVQKAWRENKASRENEWKWWRASAAGQPDRMPAAANATVASCIGLPGTKEWRASVEALRELR